MSGGAPGRGEVPGAAEAEATRKGSVAFRHRDFRLYFFSKLLSALSLHMVMMAIGYQVYDMTGDPLNLAYIGLAIFIPALAFALVTGYVADRFDRRWVLCLCYVAMLVSALLFMAFTLSGTGEVWPAFLILVLYGAGRAFHMPASNALLPNLVPVAEFPNAVAWNTSGNKVSQMSGPALGGYLYLLGPEVVYGSAAVVFALAMALTLMIRPRAQGAGGEPMTLRILLAGLRYVREKKVVLGAITLDLFVVFLGGVTALVPVYAKDILEVGADGAGWLRSAIAVGAALCALVLTQVVMTRAVGRIMFASVALFGFSTIVFGVSTAFALSFAAMVVMGAADMVSVYIRQTLIQVATPDEMRGRVSAVNAVFISTSNEIGEVRAGFVAAWIGAVPAAVVGGVGSLIVAAGCWKLFPELARVERMDRSL